VTDLSRAADRLTRAADLIERQTQAAGGPRGRWYSDREYVWLGRDERVDAGNEWDADYFATFDPAALAALVPLLRQAQSMCAVPDLTNAEELVIRFADGFAARLLREEEK
jgi:hypothetical protein